MKIDDSTSAKESGNLNQLTEAALVLLLSRRKDNSRQFQRVLESHSGMNLFLELTPTSAQPLYKDINGGGCTIRETSLRSYSAETREEHV